MIERVMAIDWIMINWVAIGLGGLAGLIVHVGMRIVGRNFQLRPITEFIAWAGAVVPIYLCLSILAGPTLYGWQHRAQAEKILTAMPFYRVLMEHDATAREDLLKAATKLPRRSDRQIGMLELGTLVEDTMRRYIPVASDHSIADLVGSMVSLMFEIQQREPERCVLLLDDRREALKGWRSPRLIRVLEAMEGVVLSGMLRPQPAPDSAWTNARLDDVLEELMENGNFLITDPSRLAAERPDRTCKEILGLHRAMIKVLPPPEVGPFLRAVLPLWFEPDLA